MARPPLPLLGLSRPPAPSSLPFSHREASSPRSRTKLPHFSSSNASSASIASSRPSQPEDFTKTPLEKSIDELQRVKQRVRDSFDRMNQTHDLFELELVRTARFVSGLEAEQLYLAELYASLLDFSARQIQRCFRGHIGRRLFRQAVVVRAVLRIQREFREFHRRREETRKRSRVLYRKVLRGLRGVRGRGELTHAELLTRVGHNLQVEAQWRKAMGVEDTESDLITALYRKKYVRRRMGAMFRQLYWLNSIANYWKSLVPQPELLAPTASTEVVSETDNGLDSTFVFDESEADDIDASDSMSDSQRKIVIVAPRVRRPVAVRKAVNRLSRDQQRHRQRMLAQRAQEESAKRDAAHNAGLDRQREADRNAERKRIEEELRLQRLQNVAQVKKRIAAEVLSGQARSLARRGEPKASSSDNLLRSLG